MYLPKSIKGKSIISNLEISESIIIDCNIDNDKSSAFDIGSSNSHFRRLYVDSINVEGGILSSQAPILFSTGSLSLNYTDPFKIDTSGNLAIKLATSNNPPIFPTVNAIYIDTTGSLNINLQAFFQTKKGLKETKYSDYLSKLGQLGSYLGYQIPNITIVEADIDSSVFEFKDNSISMLSLGLGRVPFYSQTNLTSSYKFLWNDNDSNLQINGGVVISPINYSTNSQNATNKGYVDNLNKAGVEGGLTFLQEGDSRMWSANVDNTTIHINAENKLASSLIGISPVNINPEGEVSLGYDPEYFKLNTAKQLSSTLTGISPVSVNPSNDVSLAFDPEYFKLNTAKQLSSTITGFEAININPSNQVSISVDNTTIHINAENQLASSLIGIAPITINPEGQVGLSYNPTYLALLGTELSFSTAVIDELTALTTNVEELQTLTTEHTTQITELQGLTSTHSTEITALQSQTGALEGSVGVIEGEIITIDSTLSAVVASSSAIGLSLGVETLIVGNNVLRLNSIDGQLNNIYNNNNYVSGEISAIQTDTTNIHNQINSFLNTSGNISYTNGNFYNMTIGNLEIANSITLNSSKFLLKHNNDLNHRISFETDSPVDGFFACGNNGMSFGRNNGGSTLYDLILKDGNLILNTTGTLFVNNISSPQLTTLTSNVSGIFADNTLIHNTLNSITTMGNILTTFGNIFNIISTNISAGSINVNTIINPQITNLSTGSLLNKNNITYNTGNIANLSIGSLMNTNSITLNTGSIGSLSMGSLINSNSILVNTGNISNISTGNLLNSSKIITLQNSVANLYTLINTSGSVSYTNSSIANLYIGSNLVLNGNPIHLKGITDDNHRILFQGSAVDGPTIVGNTGVILGRNNGGSIINDLVLKNGRLGLNTNNPSFLLDVQGIGYIYSLNAPSIQTNSVLIPRNGGRLTTALTDNFLYQGFTVGNYSISWNQDTDSTAGDVNWLSAYGGIKFFTKGSPRMYLSQDGNLGIGITFPTQSVDVLGSIKMTDRLIIGTSGSFFDGSLAISQNHLYVPTDNSLIFDTSQQFYWRNLPYYGDITHYSNLMNLNTSALTVLVDLNVSGNITGTFITNITNRISTLENNFPSGSLKINAVNNTIGSLTTSSSGISINGKLMDGSLGIQSGHLYSTINSPMVFDSYGTMYFRNLSSSNQITSFTDTMNISTNGLNVSNSVNCAGGQVSLTSTGIRFFKPVFINTPTNVNQSQNLNISCPNTGDNLAIFFDPSGNPTGSIRHNGTGGVNYSSASDYRMKENFKRLDSSVDIIMKVNPLSYNFIGHKVRSIGFKAHELQEVYPSAVSGIKDELHIDGSPRYQAIDYGKLTPLLWKAIQELKAELDTVKGEFKYLKEKNKISGKR